MCRYEELCVTCMRRPLNKTTPLLPPKCSGTWPRFHHIAPMHLTPGIRPLCPVSARFVPLVIQKTSSKKVRTNRFPRLASVLTCRVPRTRDWVSRNVWPTLKSTVVIAPRCQNAVALRSGCSVVYGQWLVVWTRSVVRRGCGGRALWGAKTPRLTICKCD